MEINSPLAMWVVAMRYTKNTNPLQYNVRAIIVGKDGDFSG